MFMANEDYQYSAL